MMQKHSLADGGLISNNLNKIYALLGERKKQINLVAVTKGRSYEQLKIAYNCGLRNFGENYIPELKEKMERAKKENLHDIQWHFIGNMQTNKIKFLSDVDFVHSISSLEKASKLNQLATKKIKIFLQINLNKQKNRVGFFENDVLKVLPKILEMENLEFLGLMTILPLENSKEFWFQKMVDLKEQIEAQSMVKKIELSMGMTDDFLTAIDYGANYIRLGRIIFDQ